MDGNYRYHRHSQRFGQGFYINFKPHLPLHPSYSKRRPKERGILVQRQEEIG